MFGSEVYLHGRYWEVDFLRGIGIIMMVVSNFVTDLWLFLGYNEHPLFWRLFAIATASVFIFTSGLSMWISYSRTVGKNPCPCRKYFKRSLKLLGLGALITLFTSLLPGNMTIHFGILHFLGVATLLAIPFHHLGKFNILPALFFFLGYLPARSFHDGLFLLPLGITPTHYFSPDYFPVFPWFGVYLLGMTTGTLFYPDGRRKYEIGPPSSVPVRLVAFAGRNTLLIYLLHQPVFVGLLRLLYGPLPGLSF